MRYLPADARPRYAAESSVDIGPWSNIGIFAVPRQPLCLGTAQRVTGHPSRRERNGRLIETILI